MTLISRAPMTAEMYYTASQAVGNMDIVRTIRNQYGTFIQQASQLTNVPSAVIEAFCFIESAGNPSAKSSAGAVGLMQLTPDTCVTTIHLDNKDNRVSDEQLDVLGGYLGTKLVNIRKLRYLGDEKAGNTKLVASDVINPEINLLIGAMLLGRLIDESTDFLSLTERLIRWDKVVFRYNAGYFYKIKAKTFAGVLSEAKAKATETGNYILKLVGKNGLLDSLS
ncbi:transglycosylase SLT domain-containing protein [Spirosoma aerolatum]|uniref:transglycosylase SLT domain-containing protein n=1 Tax=Spirosoma aerolatum TaxID=1211326 RepID=UPI0009AD033A|nr:transglycosylase SLT domain-containing protein [Spirosoma aerolatum]